MCAGTWSLNRPNTKTGQLFTHHNIAPPYEYGAKSGCEMCFVIESQHLSQHLSVLGVPTKTRLESRFCK